VRDALGEAGRVHEHVDAAVCGPQRIRQAACASLSASGMRSVRWPSPGSSSRSSSARSFAPLKPMTTAAPDRPAIGRGGADAAAAAGDDGDLAVQRIGCAGL
jgi:hypothetical protein